MKIERRFATIPVAVFLAVIFCTFPASAATFIVNSTGDGPDDNLSDGVCHTAVNTCTLRAAILQERAISGPHLIQFNIAGGGVHTISPASPYAIILEPVTIDGYSQPGSSPNTLAVGNDAVLLIELDGTSGGPNGLTTYAPNCTFQGLIINGFTVGIFVETVSGQPSGAAAIRGNFIGTNAAGTAALGNKSFGLLIRAPNNVIGGTSPADRNVISGNGTTGSAGTKANIKFEADFSIDTAGSVVQGNYIGTDKNGTVAIPSVSSGHGIMVQSGLAAGGGVTIGGTTSTARNIISGNPQHGINLLTNPCQTGITLTGVAIRGNSIGVDVNGAPLGNGFGGVRLQCGAIGNTIGGTAAGAGNIIAFNGAADFNGNGVNADGAVIPNGNAILGNAIYSNTRLAGGLLQAGLGIDLGDDGPTANDSGDGDAGANNRQNFPVLTTVISSGGTTQVQGALNSAAATNYRLEFFSSPSGCDPAGFGEGQVFLGTVNSTTDSFGNVTFNVFLPVGVAAGSVVTATATDPGNNTSEFSSCFTAAATAQFHTVTPCRLIETRNPVGPLGGPALSNAVSRNFVVTGVCTIPATASALSVNIAVTQPTHGPGFLTLYPGGTTRPLFSSINYNPGQTRANNSIVRLGALGDINVFCQQGGGTVHLILDVNGYFE